VREISGNAKKISGKMRKSAKGGKSRGKRCPPFLKKSPKTAFKVLKLSGIRSIYYARIVYAVTLYPRKGPATYHQLEMVPFLKDVSLVVATKNPPYKEGGGRKAALHLHFEEPHSCNLGFAGLQFGYSSSVNSANLFK